MDRVYLKSKAKDAISGNMFEIGIIYFIIFIIKSIIPGGTNGVNTDWTQQVVSMDGWEHMTATIPKGPGLIGTIFTWFVAGVAFIVYVKIAVKRERKDKVEVGEVLSFTRDRWLDFGLLSLIRNLFITLWSLLLIVPGIIKSYSYAMSEFLMYEDKEMKPTDAIKASRELMDGHKIDLFVLDLSFVGWYFLGIFTLGILWLWVAPYHFQARYNFYNEIKH